MNIYVASSWRNDHQPEVVQFLRGLGHEVYDFRNPGPGTHGFSWAEIDPQWQGWSVAKFRDALFDPRAQAGFTLDFKAMDRADACVLVLPCGRSAHLEAGWFTGRGRPVHVLVQDQCEPELMYRMCDALHTDLESLARALDQRPAPLRTVALVREAPGPTHEMAGGNSFHPAEVRVLLDCGHELRTPVMDRSRPAVGDRRVCRLCVRVPGP